MANAGWTRSKRNGRTCGLPLRGGWHRASPSSLLAHAAALGGFWYIRIHLREGQEWLQRALEEGDAVPSSERARALVWLGLILFLRGDMQGAEGFGSEGLALCRTLGDAWSLANASSATTAAPHSRSLQGAHRIPGALRPRCGHVSPG